MPPAGHFFSLASEALYNGGMDNCNCNKSFSIVGAPCKRRACIKKQEPDCTATAVIPSITVETTSGITELANCFVHVDNINTTFYVDDLHRIMLIWAGPVEVDAYDYENNPLKLRSQSCYTTVDGTFSHIYFDKTGLPHILAKEA